MKRRGPQWVGAAIALLMAPACGSSSSQSAVSDPSESPVEFQRQVVQVSSVDPDVSSSQIERCVWVAATSDQRRQGLMGVTSLGEADGMLFVQDAPTAGSFWMKDTLIELSIAFFDADGMFLDAADMTPCTSSNSSDCDRYSTPPNYLFALEVVQGGLAEFGVDESTIVSLTEDSCFATTMAE